tara:strand:+ start:1234 stop:3948 length:2715 start_codon:yes stop_codon:yes gene_type:complete
MATTIIPSTQYRAPNVRIITYKDINQIAVEESQLNYIKNTFKQYKGQTIEIGKKYISAETGKVITNNEITTIPMTGFNQWWNSFTQFLFPDSEQWIFGEDYNGPGPVSDQAQLIIMSANKVGQSNYEQFFLDGTTHCLFQPIMNWAIDCKINSKTKNTEKKYNSQINKLQKYIVKYSSGVPEKDLPQICNDLQIGLEIDLPSSILDKNTEYIRYRSQKKPIKIFKFINTRLNHIELNEVSSKDSYEQVSQEELKNIFDKQDKFKLWKGDRDNELYQVNTLDKIYRLTQKEGYTKELNEFSKLNNLDRFKIEYNSNKKLSQFLLNNVNRLNCLIVDSKYPEGTKEYYIFQEYLEDGDKNLDTDDPKTIEIINYAKSLENLNHIDLSKAYTKGAECNYYQGYLGKITDFRRCSKIMGLGIYMIYNIKNIPPLFQKLKILHENNCYTSPELEFYKSLGITFDIWCGCWGSKTDIQFTDGMFKKDDNGTKHYCKWYGCTMRLNTKERYNFDCKDIEFAKLNNIGQKADIRFNEYRNIGMIEYDKEKVYHSGHIASFIHSYARITMLEQLLNFKDISQIVAVQVDGIFYKGDVEINDLFIKKPGKSIKYIYGSEYVIDCENTKPKLPKSRKHNLVELHTGPGGAGKTHNNLVDEGLVAPLYVAPSWKLARTKAKEYNIPCTVFHYLTSKDPEVYLPNIRYYNTLVIDEITMLNDEDKELILKRFKHHKIIFCGDLGYQLPPVEGYEFNPKNLPTFRHTKNYRCQCEILSRILKKCREIIKKDLTNIDARQVLTNFGFQIHKKEDIDYSVQDLIITRTHNNKDYYSQRYKDIEKYIVKENTRDYSNGEIIIGNKPEGVKCLLQHAFTIHSIQGETCKDTLFIDINKMNCLRMLYTALSRAKTINQIKIIE